MTHYLRLNSVIKGEAIIFGDGSASYYLYENKKQSMDSTHKFLSTHYILIPKKD